MLVGLDFGIWAYGRNYLRAFVTLPSDGRQLFGFGGDLDALEIVVVILDSLVSSLSDLLQFIIAFAGVIRRLEVAQLVVSILIGGNIEQVAPFAGIDGNNVFGKSL